MPVKVVVECRVAPKGSFVKHGQNLEPSEYWEWTLVRGTLYLEPRETFGDVYYRVCDSFPAVRSAKAPIVSITSSADESRDLCGRIDELAQTELRDGDLVKLVEPCAAY
jgi:hypothetical protein